MATKKVSVEVSDNGSIAELTKQITNLNTLLDKAAKPRKALPRAASAALFASDGIESGLTRGTAAGAKRGDARDFSRQAQGLGGLVHLYATFAANVFAVTAAFNALSNAMNFANMQKAADILSTKVGTNINSVAKSMKNLTDEAISMTDALASASLAVSAGLNTSQIEKLTTVAKGASIALGRDMTDALNRVFRGTIKIEPELLDELGIMVKVNDANKEYAKTLNKTVTSLTDYERRQAFVNAVTEQGINKYKELADLGSNPYSKLIASVRDLGTETLNTLNKAIVPFISLLAQNPVALLAGGLALISTLLKLAVPSLKNIKVGWDETKQAAMDANLAQLTALRNLRSSISLADVDIDKNHLALAKMEEDLDRFSKKQLPGGKELRSVFSTLAFDETSFEQDKKKAFAAIEKARTEINARIAKFESPKKGLSLVSDEESRKIEKAVQVQKDNLQALNKLQGVVNSLTSGIAANVLQKQLLSASKEELAKLEAQEREFKAAVQRSIATRNVLEKTEQLGFRAGFAQLVHEVKTGTSEFDAHGVAVAGTARQYTLWEKTVVSTRAGLSLLTVSLSKVLGGLGVLAASFMFLQLVLSAVAGWLNLTNDKLIKLQENSNKVNESFKLYGEIQDKLTSAKNMAEIYDLQAASAKAYADALDSVNERAKTFNDFVNQTGFAGFADKAIEGLKAVFTNKGEFGVKNLDIAKEYDQLIKEDRIFASRNQKNWGGKTAQETIDSFALEDLKGRAQVISTILNALAQYKDSSTYKEFSDASASMVANLKEVNDISGEYLVSLQNQSKHLKALNAYSTSTNNLFKQLSNPKGGIPQVVKFLNETSDQFQEMSRIQLYPKLESFKAGLKEVERQAEESYNRKVAALYGKGYTSEQISSGIKVAEDARTKEVKDKSEEALRNAGFKSLTEAKIDIAKYSLEVSNSLAKLSTASASAAIEQAKLSASLKKSQFLAELSGRSTKAEEFSAERKRVAIENKAKVTNIASLEKQYAIQLDMLKAITNARDLPNNKLLKFAEKVMVNPATEDEKRGSIGGALSSLIGIKAAITIASAEIQVANLGLTDKLQERITTSFDEIAKEQERKSKLNEEELSTSINNINREFNGLVGIGSETIDTMYNYKTALVNSISEIASLSSITSTAASKLDVLKNSLKTATEKDKPALLEGITATKVELSRAQAREDDAKLAKSKLEQLNASQQMLISMKKESELSSKILELDQLNGLVSQEDVAIKQIRASLEENTLIRKNQEFFISNDILRKEIEHEEAVAAANIKLQERTKELRIQQDTLNSIDSLFTSNKPSTGLIDATQIQLFTNTYKEYLDLQQRIEQSRVNLLEGNDRIIAQEALRVKYLEKQLALEEANLVATEKLTAPFERDNDLLARRFELDAKKFRDTLESYNQTVVKASYTAVDTFVDGIATAVKNLDFNLKNIIRDTVFAFDDMMMEYAGNQLKAIMRDAIAGMFGKPDMFKSPTDLAKERQVILAQQANTLLAQIALNTSATNTINNFKALPLDIFGNKQSSMLLTQEVGLTGEDLKGWGGSINNLVKEGTLSTQQFTDSTKTFADGSNNFLNKFSDSISEFGSGVADFVKNIFTSSAASSSSSGGNFLSSLFGGFSSSGGSSAAANSGFSAADLAWFNSDAMYAGGFARGGSFRIGGQGATDSKLVQFMATPGEKVTVETPDQQNKQESVINVVNHFTITGGTTSRESQQQISAKVGLAIQRSLQRNN